jgi:hypothetical protein
MDPPFRNRVLARDRHLRDRLKGARPVLDLRALVVGANGRIGADNEEVFVGRKTLVTGAGRQYGDVSRLERENPSLAAAETHPALPAGDPEHLVDPRVVVDIVVDPVPPGVAPSVGLEEVFHDCRGIVSLAEIDGASINEEWPSRVIGDQTVILEAYGMRLPRPRELRGFVAAGTAQTRRALNVFLRVLKDWHRSPPMIAAGILSKGAAAAP